MGITKTRILTVGAVVMVTVNILLNYLLIFGNYGFPRLGIAGAALASTLSELSFLLVLLMYVFRKVDKRYYGLRFVYDGKLLVRLLCVSTWSMMYSFIAVAPWFVFFVVIEHLGAAQLAIANIVRSVSTIFFVVVCSFSTTTSSLVSNLIGAGEYKKIMPLCRKVMGTGCTRTAFVFELITVIVYLAYLFLILVEFDASLAVYWTAELLYVSCLVILCYWFMKMRYFKRYAPGM